MSLLLLVLGLGLAVAVLVVFFVVVIKAEINTENRVKAPDGWCRTCGGPLWQQTAGLQCAKCSRRPQGGD